MLYPDVHVDSSQVASFFFFIVAIDHRTHPKGKTYRGKVNGITLSGAELMYALAIKRFNEDPTFFTAEHMSKVSIKDVRDTFRIKEPEKIDIAGIDKRTSILRDCGSKLQECFNGSILDLIYKSNGNLLKSDGTGFINLLRKFAAYRDPLGKKPFLLAKFLERRHLFTIKDPDNLHVPVDNILQRLAVRTGIVILKQELDSKIRTDTAVNAEEEKVIRAETLLSFDEVAKFAGIGAPYLDDILWEFGRIHCRIPVPICDHLPNTESMRPYRIIKSGPVGKCPFGAGCQSYCDSNRWKLKEPNFKTNYY